MKKNVVTKILVTLLAALLAGTFAVGCKKADGKKKVAYIARAQADLFAAWLANSMEKESQAYAGWSVTILDGQANDDVQNNQIENAITNKYDVIVIQPNDSEAQKPAIKKAVDAGIPVIITNPRIPDEAFMAITNSVDADPYEQGGVVARYALDKIPQNGKIVVLRGPDGNMHSIERRRAWQEEFIAKRPDVEILAENTGHWNKDEGMKFMEDWAQAYTKIDAVVSMNDNMAMGALEAVKGNPKFAALQVYGVDGDAAAALLIAEGSFTATAFQNADDLAKRICLMVDDIISGKQKDIVNTDINCPLYTKDNVAELISVHKSTGALK